MNFRSRVPYLCFTVDLYLVRLIFCQRVSRGYPPLRPSPSAAVKSALGHDSLGVTTVRTRSWFSLFRGRALVRVAPAVPLALFPSSLGSTSRCRLRFIPVTSTRIEQTYRGLMEAALEVQPEGLTRLCLVKRRVRLLSKSSSRRDNHYRVCSSRRARATVGEEDTSLRFIVKEEDDMGKINRKREMENGVLGVENPSRRGRADGYNGHHQGGCATHQSSSCGCFQGKRTMTWRRMKKCKGGKRPWMTSSMVWCLW